MKYKVRIKTSNDQEFKKVFSGQLAEKKATAYALDVAVHGYKRTKFTKTDRWVLNLTPDSLFYIYPSHRIYSIIVEKIDG